LTARLSFPHFPLARIRFAAIAKKLKAWTSLRNLARCITHSPAKMPTISVDKAALFEALGREYADPGGQRRDEAT
jgi:hypothetical protein